MRSRKPTSRESLVDWEVPPLSLLGWWVLLGSLYSTCHIPTYIGTYANHKETWIHGMYHVDIYALCPYLRWYWWQVVLHTYELFYWLATWCFFPEDLRLEWHNYLFPDHLIIYIYLEYLNIIYVDIWKNSSNYSTIIIWDWLCHRFCRHGPWFDFSTLKQAAGMFFARHGGPTHTALWLHSII